MIHTKAKSLITPWREDRTNVQQQQQQQLWMMTAEKTMQQMTCRPGHQSDASTKGYNLNNKGYMHRWMQRPELPLLAKKRDTTPIVIGWFNQWGMGFHRRQRIPTLHNNDSNRQTSYSLDMEQTYATICRSSPRAKPPHHVSLHHHLGRIP
jgi:hypothetical protein